MRLNCEVDEVPEEISLEREEGGVHAARREPFSWEPPVSHLPVGAPRPTTSQPH